MSRENVEVVRMLYDAFNARDAYAIRETWTADCEWRPALIGGGVIEGTCIAAMKEWPSSWTCRPRHGKASGLSR